MAQTTQVRIPLGVMDMDTDPSRVAKEDYLYAMNYQNLHGVGSNIRGTKKRSQMLIWDHDTSAWKVTNLPAGRNKAIGRKEDRANDRILYLIWNENNQHAIHLYSYQDQKIYVIFRHSILNFQEHKLVSDSALFGDLWCFTDGYNSQRSINIGTIGKLFSDPALYEERFIELLKCPPVFPLTVSLESVDRSVSNVNELGKNVYSFIYRYHYVDHQTSRWSPESKVISAAYQGLFEHPTLNYNQIRYNWSADLIDFATGGTGKRYRKLIAYIEIAVRDGYTRSFRSIKKITMSGAATQSSDVFTNEGSYPLIANQSLDDLYDAIPLKSSCLTAIDNRIILGNNTEGFPAYNLQLGAVSETTVEDAFFAGNQLVFKNNSKNQIGVVFFDKGNRSSLVYVTESSKINVPIGFDRGSIKRYAKKFSLVGNPPSWAVGYRLVRLDTLNRSFFLQGIVNDISYLKETEEVIKKQVGTVGILRDGEYVASYGSTGVGKSRYRVCTEENKEQSLALGDPIFEGGFDVQGRKIVVVREKFDLIGDRDYYFETEITIGRSKTGNPVYYGGFDKAPSDPTRKPIIDYFVSDTFNQSKYIGINIANWYTSSQKNSTELYPNNEMYYNFQKGDRVDILYSWSNEYIGILSLPILDFRNDTLIIPVTSTLLNGLSTVLGPGTFIEVFTPQKAGEAVVYKEFGHDYKIINGEFQVKDFTITEGDVHLIKKKMYANNLETSEEFYVYSMTPDNSKMFEVWEHAGGRINIVSELKERQQTFTTQMRASQVYIQDSLINGISTFDQDLSFTYPLEYGPLSKIRPAQNIQNDVTDVLLADFAKEKVSIYIGKITLQDEAGNSQVLKSDRVFGSYNTLVGSYGSIHPSGSYQVDSRDYSWDHTKGTVVRYSQDGLTPISRVKMSKYFRYIQDSLRGKGYDVFSGFDSNNGYLFITFKSRDNTFNKTIVWDEVNNGWKSFSSISPEFYAFIGSEFIYFLEGELYVYEAGDKFNEFNGVKAKTELILSFNDELLQSKAYQSAKVHATELFTMPRIASHRITREGELEQETYLTKDNFELSEQVYTAGILNDKNTKNAKNINQALTNGDKMRGAYLITHLELDNDIDHEALLYSVMIDQTLSNPTNIK